MCTVQAPAVTSTISPSGAPCISGSLLQPIQPLLRDHPDLVRRRELLAEVPEGVHLSPSEWTRVKRFGTGIAGSRKYRSAFLDAQANGGVIPQDGYKYGEDTGFARQEEDTIYLGSFDGHGGTSEVSRSCADIYSKSLSPEFQEALKTKNAQELFQRNSELFHRMHKAVEHIPVGGSTAYTAAIHTLEKGEVTALTSHMGDSGGFFVDLDSGRILMAFSPHVWENPEEYKAYVAYCERVGITPMEPIYGSFNFGGTKIPNPQGRLEPFKLYERDEHGQIVLHKKNKNYVWRKVQEICSFRKLPHRFGGLQSEERSIQQIQLTDGSWVDYAHHPEHCHENWGSVGVVPGTINKIQMTRAIGDNSYPLRREVVSRLFSVPPDWKRFVYVQGSDGFLDRFSMVQHSDIILDIVRENPEIGGQGIADKIFERVTQGYKPVYCLENGKPKWDDVHIITDRWERE